MRVLLANQNRENILNELNAVEISPVEYIDYE